MKVRSECVNKSVFIGGLVTAWMGTHVSSAKILLLQIFILGLFIRTARSECKVLKCTSQYARSTDQLNPNTDRQYCTALRAYADCVRRTARTCRGDLNYHSTAILIPDLMENYNCSPVPPAEETNKPVHQADSANTPIPTTAFISYFDDQMCSYHGRRSFRHCGLFGDPHLRTFYDEYQTCKVAGAWPLIDNSYLAVQVSNVKLSTVTGATATSKLTVIVKGHPDCADQKVYEAHTNNLPSAFIDGTQSSGRGRSLVVVEVVPDHHIEIHVKFIATTIVVRQIGRYLTFAIRMPDDLIHMGESPDSLQLCVKGCPRSERIDYTELLTYPSSRDERVGGDAGGDQEVAMSREDAIGKCRETNITDFYFDSCVFDLMTTGDMNFTVAAKEALHDVLRLHPNGRALQRNRTSIFDTLSSLGTDSSGPRTSLNSITLILIVLGVYYLSQLCHHTL